MNDAGAGDQVSVGLGRATYRSVAAWQVEAAAVAATVAALYLAAPGGPLPLLAWVALAPLYFVLHQAPPLRATAYAGLSGFLGWLATFALGSVEAAERLGASPVVAWLLNIGCCLYQAVPFAVAGGLCAYWLRLVRLGGVRSGKAGWCRALAFTTLWTITLGWFPDLLPGNMTHALYGFPRLIQVLDIGGLPFLTFVLLLASAVLAEAVAAMPRSFGRGMAFLLAAAAVPALVAVYGTWRLAAIEQAPATALRVGFVQPAFPVEDDLAKPLARAGRDQEMAQILALTDHLAATQPDLDVLLWPEVPFLLAPGNEDQRVERIQALARARHVPIVFTGEGRDGDTPASPTYSRLFTVTADGALGPHYDKMILVPFTEYLPFDGLVPGLRQIFNLAGIYHPGHDAAPLALPDLALANKAKLIPAICYESIFASHIQQSVARGGDLIVNPVDDGWFGHSRVGAYHLALALFQTVSYRVPLAFVSNGGPSMLIAATGAPVAGTVVPADDAGSASAVVRIPKARSLYAATGDLFLYGLTLVIAGIVAGAIAGWWGGFRRHPPLVRE